MADALTPPAMTIGKALFYTVLLIVALWGGYYYLKQDQTKSIFTPGQAIRSQADAFHCTPSLTRMAQGESDTGLMKTWLKTDQIDVFLRLNEDETARVGSTYEEIKQKRVGNWQVEKNTADQLVLYAKDPNNPIMDRAGSLVIDKTNGVGLFKNTLNRQFQYLACQEVEW